MRLMYRLQKSGFKHQTLRSDTDSVVTGSITPSSDGQSSSGNSVGTDWKAFNSQPLGTDSDECEMEFIRKVLQSGSVVVEYTSKRPPPPSVPTGLEASTREPVWKRRFRNAKATIERAAHPFDERAAKDSLTKDQPRPTSYVVKNGPSSPSSTMSVITKGNQVQNPRVSLTGSTCSDPILFEIKSTMEPELEPQLTPEPQTTPERTPEETEKEQAEKERAEKERAEKEEEEEEDEDFDETEEEEKRVKVTVEVPKDKVTKEKGKVETTRTANGNFRSMNKAIRPPTPPLKSKHKKAIASKKPQKKPSYVIKQVRSSAARIIEEYSSSHDTYDGDETLDTPSVTTVGSTLTGSTYGTVSSGTTSANEYSRGGRRQRSQRRRRGGEVEEDVGCARDFCTKDPFSASEIMYALGFCRASVGDVLGADVGCRGFEHEQESR